MEEASLGADTLAIVVFNPEPEPDEDYTEDDRKKIMYMSEKVNLHMPPEQHFGQLDIPRTAVQEGARGATMNAVVCQAFLEAKAKKQAKKKVEAKKVEGKETPSRGTVILVTAAAAALFALIEQACVLLPKMHAGEISGWTLMKQMCQAVVMAAVASGGIGACVAVLEELLPQLASSFGLALIFASIVFGVIPAVARYCNNEITFGEMIETIMQILAANGGGYAGGMLGAALGTAGGPIGIVIGCCIGGWLGCHIGSWLVSGVKQLFGWLFGCRPTECLLDSLTIHYKDGKQSQRVPDECRRQIVTAVEGGVFGFFRTDPVRLNEQLKNIEKELDKHMRKFALRYHPDKNLGSEEEAEALYVVGVGNCNRIKKLLLERIGYKNREILRQAEKNKANALEIDGLKTQAQKDAEEILRLKAELKKTDALLARSG